MEIGILGVCQTPVTRDRGALEAMLKRAVDGGCGLVLLPELFWGGFAYGEKDALVRESLELSEWLGEFSRGNGVVVAGTLWEERGGEYFNRFHVVTPQDGVSRPYAKRHLFPLSEEEEEFASGEAEPEVVEIGGVRFGLAVCFELRFPEVFRAQAAGGPEVFLAPSQWPMARAGHLRALTVARAIENQCYVLSCNGCGPTPYGELAGGSCLVSPWGEVVFSCGVGQETAWGRFDRDLLTRAREPFDSRASRFYSVVGR